MCDEVAQFKGAAQFKGHLEDVRLSSCRCYTRPGIDACGELIPEVVPVLIITLNTSADWAGGFVSSSISSPWVWCWVLRNRHETWCWSVSKPCTVPKTEHSSVCVGCHLCKSIVTEMIRFSFLLFLFICCISFNSSYIRAVCGVFATFMEYKSKL